MIHIWVTKGSEESYHFHQIHKVLLFPLPLWAHCLTESPPHTRLWKIVLQDLLHCRFIYRHAIKMLKTYSEFSFLDGSSETNFRSLDLYKSNRHFKTQKQFVRSISAPETGRNLSDRFFHYKRQLLGSG